MGETATRGSFRVATAIFDRASVVSLREAEAKDRLNKD
jgi:hypothetical protein